MISSKSTQNDEEVDGDYTLDLKSQLIEDSESYQVHEI